MKILVAGWDSGGGVEAVQTVVGRAVARGHQVRHHTDLVRRWSGQIVGRGACGLPDGAVQFVSSALEVFAAELERHAVQGACAAIRQPSGLPLPRPDARERGWR